MHCEDGLESPPETADPNPNWTVTVVGGAVAAPLALVCARWALHP